ncbi:MAG: hypothetical protein K5672_05070, partial [Bacteroidaceae bacterium]|nr:hypothetical protein [Bacteroidaceae bacterium]
FLDNPRMVPNHTGKHLPYSLPCRATLSSSLWLHSFLPNLSPAIDTPSNNLTRSPFHSSDRTPI